ncbi:uncharacterized protein LOC111260864 isoform X2 [Varroa jacobsoni]|uniref:Uncharacterized protein n=1 Tax=Varroa destructor TaxID=109461 RepID=A0A7M7MJY4_VARDE|nr:uncharacterized protein LOC111255454 isoform X2 [Varroa destructor]XP_022689652.1 uncharacterized protein LOC111260864 isoform X2 [Varroa jacobsoni]
MGMNFRLSIEAADKSSHTRPHGALFLFNVCDRDSFLYMIALLQKLKPVFNSNTIRYLVGTQRDQRSGNVDEPNETNIEEAVTLAVKNLMRYRETSATTSEGVQGAFMSVIYDVHRLGLRLEDQSLIRNLGSFVSLPRMKEDILINFSRKLSLDSDSSEYASELSCAECDINDFVNSPDVGLDESAMDEAAVDRIASEDQRVDDLEISSKDNTCYRL